MSLTVLHATPALLMTAPTVGQAGVRVWKQGAAFDARSRGAAG